MKNFLVAVVGIAIVFALILWGGVSFKDTSSKNYQPTEQCTRCSGG